MAGGYNSYHEAIHFGLPTICYPNIKTAKDNQLKRVRVAEENDCMIVLTEVNSSNVQSAIGQMLNPEFRNTMRINMSKMRMQTFQNKKFVNGADEMAYHLVEALKRIK